MRRNNAGRIQEFSDDLRNLSEDLGGLARFGIVKEADKEVDKILADVVMATNALAQVAKEVEFFVQGDITREVFLKRYKTLESRLNTELA